MTEEAAFCISDMRHNKSGSVPSNCNLRKLMQDYDHNCCPKESTENGKLHLDKRTSAYPLGKSCKYYLSFSFLSML